MNSRLENLLDRSEGRTRCRMAARARALIGDRDLPILLQAEDFHSAGVELDIGADLLVDHLVYKGNSFLDREPLPSWDASGDLAEVPFDGGGVVIGGGVRDICALLHGRIDSRKNLVEVGIGEFGKSRRLFLISNVLIDQISRDAGGLIVILPDDKLACDFGCGQKRRKNPSTPTTSLIRFCCASSSLNFPAKRKRSIFSRNFLLNGSIADPLRDVSERLRRLRDQRNGSPHLFFGRHSAE